jgi:hypothetical protein
MNHDQVQMRHGEAHHWIGVQPGVQTLDQGVYERRNVIGVRPFAHHEVLPLAVT